MLLLGWAVMLCAQEYAVHWIGVPDPDSLSHVWFRQTYVEQGRPQQAFVSVVTSGYYKLYVNECNVGTAAFYPSRETYSDKAVSMTFDVTPYLRSDTDVVAICYAPSYPHLDSCQISVLFYGIDSSGRAFSRASDGDWLCRLANSRWTTDGGEVVDGRWHNSSWKAACFDPALWLSAECRKDPRRRLVTYLSPDAPVIHLDHSDSYSFFDPDSAGVTYDFGVPFHGMLRLTLREARHGERIFYDGMEYICSGEMDEQVFSVFRIGDYRRIRVTGDSRFRRDQVVNVEALRMVPRADGNASVWP